jgi:tetratricopeptide (TPR) repeat protein
MGDYDQALSNLMNALDTARKANDTKDSAEASESVGKVLTYEGRLGAALSAMQDAVNGFRSTKNESAELAESLNDLADTLTLAGRGNESAKLLEEATKIAGDLKNESIQSELLNTRGDAAFFGRDYKAARSSYEKAAQAAAKAKDREKMLIPRMNLARVSIAEGRSQAAIPELRNAIQQADSFHLKYYWLRGSVDLAEAMIKTKDYAHARQELDQTLNSSEKLGTRLLTATIHFDMGNLLKQTGDGPGAARQYRQASALVEEISKEPGAEHVLDRPDLKMIYTESKNIQ